MKKSDIKYLLISLAIGIIASCANPGTPSGGPKDEMPPKIKKSTPENNALNYKEKEVSIIFDELIQLKEVNQKLVVSPPVNKQPSVVARGNELLITFNEDLQENTTYTLDFADAISDNNEGNVLENFSFSFSTGSTVDSLAVAGHVFKADDLTPSSGSLVFLHENHSDTAFQTLVPVRLAKSDANGAFRIKNVRPGSYKIYALDDSNNNYKYDQPGEQIAWLDSLIVPAYEYRTVADTIKRDKLKPKAMATDSLANDSTANDSIVFRQVLTYIPDSIRLFKFTEESAEQYITANDRKERACLKINFKRKPESFSIEPLIEHQQDWAMFEYSRKKDSIAVWLKDTALIANDSLPMLLKYEALDSLKNTMVKNDTLVFYYFDTTVKKKETKKKKAETEEIPSIKINGLENTLDIFSRLTFNIEAAPVEIDEKKIMLNEVIDSISTPIDFTFTRDSLNIRRFYVDRQWTHGSTYELVIDSAAFRDVYDKVNNPLKVTTNILKEDSYATIYMTIEKPKNNWLVQILNTTNEGVVRQTKVPANGKIAFRLIKPGDYLLRIVVDENNNNQWDIGNYKTHLQPETIYYYDDKITTRANWEHTVKWNPNKFDIFKFVNTFRKTSSSKEKKRD